MADDGLIVSLPSPSFPFLSFPVSLSGGFLPFRFSLPFAQNPAQDAQAEDRAYRIGQLRDVEVSISYVTCRKHIATCRT